MYFLLNSAEWPRNEIQLTHLLFAPNACLRLKIKTKSISLMFKPLRCINNVLLSAVKLTLFELQIWNRKQFDRAFNHVMCDDSLLSTCLCPQTKTKQNKAWALRTTNWENNVIFAQKRCSQNLLRSSNVTVKLSIQMISALRRCAANLLMMETMNNYINILNTSYSSYLAVF
jgi:hypothetical protein